MEFFDKKEEVIDIQLTSYGKELYSRGDFRPVFYSFFDEGILYDGSRGGVAESQNNIQDRIKNLTPQMKGSKEYISPNKIVAKSSLISKDLQSREVSLYDFDSTYENQLGVSKNNSENAPSWRVKVLQGELDSSTLFLSASTTSRDLSIPQMNILKEATTYNTKIIKDGVAGLEGMDPCEIQEFISPEFGEFLDGSLIAVEENHILLKIEESNSVNLLDNFEFEIFEVKEKKENQITTNTTLTPLKFFHFQPQVQAGIMMDEGFNEEDFDNLEKIDNTFASHYLEILIDENIDQDVLCKLDPGKKENTIFIKDFVSCEDIERKKIDIYGELDDSNMEDFVDEECD